MADAVYRIGDVRDKVLALLRKEGVMTAGAISLKLGMPYWAAKSGIESGQAGGLIVFVPGAGYRAATGQIGGVS